jgi:hypothetical protein
LAVIAAAEQLRSRPDLQAMIAATVDEDLVDEELAERQPPREGAAAWVLGDAGPVELAGWALAGPEQPERAIERARAQANEPAAELERLDELHPSLASRALIDIGARLGQTPRVFVGVTASVASWALVLRRVEGG